MMRKTSNSKNGIKRLAGLFLCIMLTLLLTTQIALADDKTANKNAVDPVGNDENYSTVIYDINNGLPTTVANDIAQTKEGFIWIASYGGLIRYDGNNFERIDSTDGVNSVGCIFVDSKDRLWIGTNEDGIGLMNDAEQFDDLTMLCFEYKGIEINNNQEG